MWISGPHPLFRAQGAVDNWPYPVDNLWITLWITGWLMGANEPTLVRNPFPLEGR